MAADSNEVTLAVVICTHNPKRNYLRRTLEALARQTLDRSKWDAVVIDNASRPALELAEVQSVLPHGRLVREEVPGLTPARLCAITSTSSDLLVFVDDDNLLEPDYLAAVRKLAMEWPQIGVFSGAIKPDFEVPPPKWTIPFHPYLALRELSHSRWGNAPDQELPIGAGMVVRRRVAEYYYAEVKKGGIRFNMDRKGKSLLAGGDTDIGFTALNHGFGCGSFIELNLVHIIPAGRLTKAYLCRLVKDIRISHRLLYCWHGRDWEYPTWRWLIRKTRAMVRYYLTQPFSAEARFHYWEARGDLTGGCLWRFYYKKRNKQHGQNSEMNDSKTTTVNG